MKPHYDDGINLPLRPMTNKNIFTSRDGRRSPPFRHDHGSYLVVKDEQPVTNLIKPIQS